MDYSYIDKSALKRDYSADEEHIMTEYESRDLMHDLEMAHPCGCYQSRCSIALDCLNAGIIAEWQYDQLRSFYGSIWNYTGD